MYRQVKRKNLHFFHAVYLHAANYFNVAINSLYTEHIALSFY